MVYVNIIGGGGGGEKMPRHYKMEGGGGVYERGLHIITCLVIKHYALCIIKGLLRNRSLIMGRGGYKMRKLRIQNLLRPPWALVKTFMPPPF